MSVTIVTRCRQIRPGDVKADFDDFDIKNTKIFLCTPLKGLANLFVLPTGCRNIKF